MSEIETAQLHLNRALRRLEGVLARRMAEKPGANAPPELGRITAERDGLVRDVGLLRSECDRLTAALGSAEEAKRQLHQVTSQVAGRLDGSIAELDRLLGG
jgi:hypothetical protein